MRKNKTQWQNRAKAVALSGLMLAGCLIPALQAFDVSADAFTEAGVTEPVYSENLVVGGGTYENVLAAGETEKALTTTADTVSGAWNYNGTTTGSIVKEDGNTMLKLNMPTHNTWYFAAQNFTPQGAGNYLVSFDYHLTTPADNAYVALLDSANNKRTIDQYSEYPDASAVDANLFSAETWMGYEAGTEIQGKEGWYHFEEIIRTPTATFNSVYFIVYQPRNVTEQNFYVDNVSVKYASDLPESYSKTNLFKGDGTFESVLTDGETEAVVGTTYTEPVNSVWSNANWTDSPASVVEDPTDSSNTVLKLAKTTGTNNFAHAFFNFDNRGAGKYLLEFDFYSSNNANRANTDFGKVAMTEGVYDTVDESYWSNEFYDISGWHTDVPSKVWYQTSISRNCFYYGNFHVNAGTAIEGKEGWYHFKGYVDVAENLEIFRIYVNHASKYYMLIDNVSVRTVKPLCEDETYFDWTVDFGHSASFHNNLTMNYYVPASDLADYDSYYLSVEKAVWNKDGTWGKETARIDGTLTENGYKFVFDGIAAAEAGNTLKATLYATADGKTYKSQVDTYSVKEYAYNRLAASDDQAFKTLLVDMLNYCAAAQVYFDVNADNLVNADLTAEQQALATAGEVSVSDNSAVTVLNGATAQIVGKSIVFNDSVEVKLYMDLSGVANRANVTVKVTYTDAMGEEQTVEKAASEFVYDSATGYYTVKLDGLNAAEMRVVFEATVFDGTTAISDTISYSVETYVYNRLNASTDEAFKALIRELIKYSDSAKAYFA
ncbi:MAG: hypothetical protein IJY62_00165 [Clostridia bacterium]|nr:hypothetical protein [Clostridia bacterium]